MMEFEIDENDFRPKGAYFISASQGPAYSTNDGGGLYTQSFLKVLENTDLCASWEEFFEKTKTGLKHDLAVGSRNKLDQTPGIIYKNHANPNHSVVDVLGQVSRLILICPRSHGIGTDMDVKKFLRFDFNKLGCSFQTTVLADNGLKEQLVKENIDVSGIEFVDPTQANARAILKKYKNSSDNVFLAVFAHGINDFFETRDQYVLFPGSENDLSTRIDGTFLAKYSKSFEKRVLVCLIDSCESYGIPDIKDFRGDGTKELETNKPPEVKSRSDRNFNTGKAINAVVDTANGLWGYFELAAYGTNYMDLSKWVPTITALMGLVLALCTLIIYVTRCNDLLSNIFRGVALWAFFSIFIPFILDVKLLQHFVSLDLSLSFAAWGVVSGFGVCLFAAIAGYRQSQTKKAVWTFISRILDLSRRTVRFAPVLISHFLFNEHDRVSQIVGLKSSLGNPVFVAYYPSVFSQIRNESKCLIFNHDSTNILVENEGFYYETEMDSEKLVITCDYQKFREAVQIFSKDANNVSNINQLMSWTFNNTETLDLSLLHNEDLQKFMQATSPKETGNVSELVEEYSDPSKMFKTFESIIKPVRLIPKDVSDYTFVDFFGLPGVYFLDLLYSSLPDVQWIVAFLAILGSAYWFRKSRAMIPQV